VTAAQAGVEPGDAHDVYINQGLREGWVLATIDRQYLVEYTMPKGTTALLVGTVGASTMKSVSYTAVSRKWLQAIVDAGSVWEGKAQSIYRAPNKHGYGGNNQTVPSAEQLLAAKGQK
jgi:hypothetical protein